MNRRCDDPGPTPPRTTGLVLAALVLAGCARPAVWADVREGMDIDAAERALVSAHAEVTRPIEASYNPASQLAVVLADGSHATILFHPRGHWHFISVRSPPVSPGAALEIRARIAARLGPPAVKGGAVSAEWPDGSAFRSQQEHDQVVGTFESRVAKGARTGALPIGPAGLRWGMSPKEVRGLLEGTTDEIDDSESELEFGGTASWLTVSFDNRHLNAVAYWQSPPLERDSAVKRLAKLENELGPATLVEESDEWTWPARSAEARILRVRGQSTAVVEQLYRD